MKEALSHSDTALSLQAWFQSDACNENSIVSPRFVSMHPGGGLEVIDLPSSH